MKEKVFGRADEIDTIETLKKLVKDVFLNDVVVF